MAAVALTPQSSARGGTELNFSTPDAADGVEFNNKSKKGILLVKNDSGSSVTVTIDITKTLDGMTLSDRTVTVGAGEVSAIGPFNEIYNQSDDYVRVKFSAVASVGVALLTPGSLSS